MTDKIKIIVEDCTPVQGYDIVEQQVNELLAAGWHIQQFHITPYDDVRYNVMCDHIVVVMQRGDDLVDAEELIAGYRQIQVGSRESTQSIS